MDGNCGICGRDLGTGATGHYCSMCLKSVSIDNTISLIKKLNDLRAEVERLRADRDLEKSMRKDADARADDAEKQVERLREELEKIRAAFLTSCDKDCPCKGENAALKAKLAEKEDNK